MPLLQHQAQVVLNPALGTWVWPTCPRLLFDSAGTAGTRTSDFRSWTCIAFVCRRTWQSGIGKVAHCTYNNIDTCYIVMQWFNTWIRIFARSVRTGLTSLSHLLSRRRTSVFGQLWLGLTTSHRPVFEKTCATTQKNVKSRVFLKSGKNEKYVFSNTDTGKHGSSINQSIFICSKCPEIHIKGFSIASRTTKLRPALTAAQVIN